MLMSAQTNIARQQKHLHADEKWILLLFYHQIYTYVIALHKLNKYKKSVRCLSSVTS